MLTMFVASGAPRVNEGRCDLITVPTVTIISASLRCACYATSVKYSSRESNVHTGVACVVYTLESLSIIFQIAFTDVLYLFIDI